MALRVSHFLPLLAGLLTLSLCMAANLVERRPQEASEYRGDSYRPVCGFPFVFLRHHYHRNDGGFWLTYGIIPDPDEARPSWEIWLFGRGWRVSYPALMGNVVVSLAVAGVIALACRRLQRLTLKHHEM